MIVINEDVFWDCPKSHWRTFKTGQAEFCAKKLGQAQKGEHCYKCDVGLMAKAEEDKFIRRKWKKCSRSVEDWKDLYLTLRAYKLRVIKRHERLQKNSER